MGSPRVDLVFRLWQCDKENHGWREGPPQTVLPSSIGWLAFTLLVSQRRTKKEYCFALLAASPSLRTLAGLKRLLVQLNCFTAVARSASSTFVAIHSLALDSPSRGRT